VTVRVDLFVDPACMWSWLTSRWLAEVAPKRNLEVRWRPYSLLLRDGPEGLQDWKATVWGRRCGRCG
jgi:predicted DsbA family dithiol-disulfide isomerase